MKIENMKKDPDHGLDSYRSKVVLVYISWIMFTSTTSLRAMGVTYIGILGHFNTSRETASWPGTVAMSAFGIGGPLFGLLSEVWSYHVVLVACTLLTSVGIMICYFSPSVPFITFFFGVVYGAALSGVFIAANGLCSQYFKRWMNTANGIAWGCQCIGAFFIPDVAIFILRELGALEIFLFVGAITLNSFPAALFLRSPPWTATGKSPKASGAQNDLPTQDLSESHRLVMASDECRQDVSEEQGEQVTRTSLDNAVSCNERSLEELRFESAKVYINDTVVKPSNAKSEVKEALKAFCNLSFIHDAISYGIYFYTMTTYFLIHVDLALDRNVLPSQAIYLQHMYSIGDFTMRVFSGVIIDRGHLTVRGTLALGFLGSATAFEALAWSPSLLSLLPSALLLGLSQGMIAPLPGTLLKNDFVDNSLPMMMGGMFGFMGLLLMTRPPLVGYFKDNIGKYDGLLHIFSGFSALLFLIWFGRTLYKGRKSSTQL